MKPSEIPFLMASSGCVLSRFSRVRLCVTLWTVAHQAPLSRNSPGKNSGVGCHFLLQGIFPTQGLNPGPPALQADSLPSESPGMPITFYYDLSLYVHTAKS